MTVKIKTEPKFYCESNKKGAQPGALIPIANQQRCYDTVSQLELIQPQKSRHQALRWILRCQHHADDP